MNMYSKDHEQVSKDSEQVMNKYLTLWTIIQDI